MTSDQSWERRLPGFLRPPAMFEQGGGSGRESGYRERMVTPRLALLFLGSAAVLVPWTVLLFITLPPSAEAAHWDVAWGGFDAMLILVFTGAAVRILRVSPRSATVTAAAGALLVTDAWFDVMTSATGGELAEALLMAVLVELPMAALCLRTSLRVVSVLEQARRYLIEAGFTIEHGQLVPPPGESTE